MTKNCKHPLSQEAALSAREHGFTILELIVAITILSLVTVLIGSGFRLALNSWDKGEAETEWTQRMRVLSGQLSQQIKSAYPYKMKIDDKSLMVFEGKNDSIMFATAFSDSSSGGFKWVRYSFRDQTLFYKEGLLPDKKMDEKISGDEDIMDPDVQEVKFEYLSPDEDGWKESWDEEDRLPGAVRVTISFLQPVYISIPMGMKKKKENDG